MSRTTPEQFDAALNAVLIANTEPAILKTLNKALRVSKGLPRIVTPTAINRSAGRSIRRASHKLTGFRPDLSLIGRRIVVWDDDGVEIARGILIEIWSKFQYQIEIGTRYEVFDIRRSLYDLDTSSDELLLAGAVSLGDLA